MTPGEELAHSPRYAVAFALIAAALLIYVDFYNILSLKVAASLVVLALIFAPNRSLRVVPVATILLLFLLGV